MNNFTAKAKKAHEGDKVFKYSVVISFVRLCAPLWLIFFLYCSCTRGVSDETPALITWSGAYPMAILQPGNHPLWFKLTEEGPVHIETVEDITETYALVPWPHAVHICFLEEHNDGIVMVVNRYGFLSLSPNDGRERGIALYRFSGGDFWQQYSVGGFVLYQGNPAAVLYLDDRFITSDAELPQPRTWSFNMNSNAVFPLNIPALQQFPENELWNIDILRPANDGLIYYRIARRTGPEPRIRMFRTSDLSNTFPNGTEEISIETFYNSTPREREFSHPSLPPLPEGFVYTGIARTGNSLFAAWEEQEDFSIGAAGFLVIKP